LPPDNPRADRIPGRREYGGLLLVPVLCNESERLYFLVDTGASLTAITNEVAHDLAMDLGARFGRGSLHPQVPGPFPFRWWNYGTSESAASISLTSK
jgi:hypothetical protein